MSRYPKARYATWAVALTLSISAGACQAPPRREPVLSAFAMTDVRLPEPNHWGASYTPPAAYEKDASGHFRLEFTLRALYEEYNAATSPSRRKELRNRIAYTFLTLIKHYHDATTDDVYELTAAIATGFDIFSMAMGGLGAATGTASDKAVYSALAAFGVGVRSSLAKNILAEQTTQAILQQMEAQRLMQETKIRQALAQSDAAYPLSEALTDLYDYYTAGSVKDAVAELAKSAQIAKDRAQTARNAVMKGGGGAGEIEGRINTLIARADAIASAQQGKPAAGTANSIKSALAQALTRIRVLRDDHIRAAIERDRLAAAFATAQVAYDKVKADAPAGVSDDDPRIKPTADLRKLAQANLEAATTTLETVNRAIEDMRSQVDNLEYALEAVP